MTLEENFRAALLADSAVAGYLAGRLYLEQLPNGPTFPCAAYQRVSTVPQSYSHTPAAGQKLTQWARIQLTIWAATGIVTSQIAQAVVNALNGFNLWEALASPALSPNGFPNFLMNQRMMIEPQTNPPLYKTILDLKIWFRDN